MSGDTIITIVGNLGGDPELRFTPSGAAVCTFTVGSTPRTFDKTKKDWVDGETLWMRCSVWREQAENVAESLTKGTAVIVQGRLKSRSFETKTGDKRTVIELDVEEVGPSLRKATAKVTKGGVSSAHQARGGSQGGFGGNQSSGGFGLPSGSAQAGWGGHPSAGFGQDEDSPF